MTDKQIIKGLECCAPKGLCDKCPYNDGGSSCWTLEADAAKLLKRLQKRIDELEYTLEGVMHFVDKWLDDSELNQGEVNRAIAMREKTLQIVERLEEENEFLKGAINENHS